MTASQPELILCSTTHYLNPDFPSSLTGNPLAQLAQTCEKIGGHKWNSAKKVVQESSKQPIKRYCSESQSAASKTACGVAIPLKKRVRMQSAQEGSAAAVANGDYATQWLQFVQKQQQKQQQESEQAKAPDCQQDGALRCFWFACQAAHFRHEQQLLQHLSAHVHELLSYQAALSVSLSASASASASASVDCSPLLLQPMVNTFAGTCALPSANCSALNLMKKLQL